jgi:hypothetical protein
MAPDTIDPIERWTVTRRVALVVSLLKGETSIAEAARTHGLTVAEVEEWREKILLGAENALRSRPKDEEALKDEQIKKLKQKFGGSGARQRQLTGGVETLPFGPEDIRRVRATLSGVSERRSCRVLHVCRAGLYRPATIGQRRSAAGPLWIEPLRRLIHQHPTFGYRHLWALLRGQEGIIVNRKAVYRVLKQKR